MESLEVIKQLVDSLTGSLTNILVKIESINPVLTQLTNEVKEGSGVNQETIDAVKEIKLELSNYHDTLIQLPVVLKQVSEIHEMMEEIDKKLEAIKVNTDTIPAIAKSVQSNGDSISPVSKIASWIMTPVGIIASLIGLALFIFGTLQTIQWFAQTFATK